MNCRAWFLWTFDVRSRLLEIGMCDAVSEESRAGWCLWCAKHAVVGQA